MNAEERINQIKYKLIHDDWVEWAGNKFMLSDWEDRNKNNFAYIWKALMQYLNEIR